MWTRPSRWARPADRREFLAMMAGVASIAASASRAMPANHMSPIGVQLYTVRRLLDRDFGGTLRELAAVGFREVEFAGYHGHTPPEIRTALDSAGLVAPSAQIPIDAARNDWSRVLASALVMGHRYVVIAWIPERERTRLDGYRAAADLFNRLGRQALTAGLRFAYHNHDFEFPRLDGRIPYDVLLERSDPRYVAFEMDLYWITKGGQDPLTYFARWPGRFPLLHLKDSGGPPEHRMVDVGAGVIPWKAILARRQQAGTEHCFVEHDDPADPIASVRRSYEYLRRLEL